VSRQRIQSQNWPWGLKLPHVHNLGGGFVAFFLGAQNRNFEKVRELKLSLSQLFIRSQQSFFFFLQKKPAKLFELKKIIEKIIINNNNLLTWS